MKKALAVLVTCLALGCTEKPKAPAMNIYGHRGLAILPFRNTSSDPALAAAVTAELETGLGVLKPLPVSGPAVTAAIAPDAGLMPGADVGAKLAAASAPGSDLIMTGEVTGYREMVTIGDPKRIKASYRAGAWKWGCSEDATVTFLVTVRLADLVTGKQLWLRTVNAEGKSSRWSDLSWDGSEPKAPPDGWDAIKLKAGVGLTATGSIASAPRFTTDSNLEHARGEALTQAARAVLNDFTGRGGWTP